MNDVHSRLNETVVREVVPVDSLDAVRTALASARERGGGICIGGGWHAMGGQQFAVDATLLDTRPLARVLDLDAERGIVEVEAGIQWPDVLAFLSASQPGAGGWGIAQKQSGADRLSLGGAISANGHGRGLAMKPIVGDVESFMLVTADCGVVTCSREENSELFRLVIGGYGLFGVVYSVRLRLAPRRKLERIVEIVSVDRLMDSFDDRIASGFLYGDFQFAIDPGSEDFLHRGVFSCYRPVPDATPASEGQRALTPEDWRKLLYLTHARKTEAFERYAAHYMATSGQIYSSDAHQFAYYIDDYHTWLDGMLQSTVPGSEMITEIYVPRDRLVDFLAAAAHDFRENDVAVVYGTVRLIERDDETFLAWARERYACTIFNLHVTHTPEDIARSADAFRRLIDLAIARGGSYFLTYHRHARLEQVEACYPRFREFLEQKRQHDPEDIFQSDWYRHYRDALAR